MLIPNLAKIAYLHNSKKNEIGYILSNGPSLQNENLSKLKGKHYHLKCFSSYGRKVWLSLIILLLDRSSLS